MNSENIKNIRELSNNDILDCGSKAVKLGLLMRKGFFVPNGFCISTRAFNRYFGNMEGFSNSINYFTVDTKNLKTFVAEKKMSSSLIVEIKERIKSEIDEGVVSFAVRSSGTDEDSEDYSFAGLYKSYLNLKTSNEIVEAIKSVWLSIWDDAAIQYRKKIYSNNKVNHNQAMAVIVQEMIDAKFSGVCFTKNPIAQDNSCLIEFTQGTAKDLVEGDINGSRVLVDRSSLKIQSNSSKNLLKGGLDLERVAKIALKVEKVFGSHQDIEWCIDSQNRIWVIQSRSITSKSINSIPKTKKNELQLMYNEPFSTLGCDLAIKRHIAWVKGINKLYFLSIKPKLKLRGSLIYSNKQPLSEVNWLIRLWLRIVDIVFLINSRYVLNIYTRETLPKYKSILSDIQKRYSLSRSLDELAGWFDKVIFIYIDSQIKSFPIGTSAKTALNVYSRYIRFTFDKKDSIDLFSYITYRNPTTHRDASLETLLLKIKNYLPFESINEMSLSKLRRILQKDLKSKKYLKQLETFLEKNSYLWADRYPRDPGWELDEKRLISTIVNGLQLLDKDNLSVSVNKRKSKAKRALKELETNISLLYFGRFRMLIFKILLFKVNCLAGFKEERNLFLYSVNMIIRTVALEIGRRLEIKGELLSQNDIFYLKQNEISKICSGNESGLDYREKIQKRKNSFSTIKENGIPRTANFSSNRQNGIRTSNRFYGIGCCTGLAKGKVRIISNGNSLSSLKQGEIAVCYNFRPAWSIILGEISGLVVEQGNVLSHGAILAREYGVPTVVNIPGIVSEFDNGNLIEVDGSSGFVSLIAV